MHNARVQNFETETTKDQSNTISCKKINLFYYIPMIEFPRELRSSVAKSGQ